MPRIILELADDSSGSFSTGASLTNVEGLKDLENLQKLDLTYCERLTGVDALKDLKNLQKLNIAGCPRLPADVIVELHKQLVHTVINGQ